MMFGGTDAPHGQFATLCYSENLMKKNVKLINLVSGYKLPILGICDTGTVQCIFLRCILAAECVGVSGSSENLLFQGWMEPL